MDNLHPVLVHFPIALLSSFFLLDLAGFLLGRRTLVFAAGWMLWLGTLGALAAVATGLQAALTVGHPESVHEILENHRNFGLNTTALALFLTVWRTFNQGRFSRPGHLVHLLGAALMLLNLARGADLGGLMVYRYGVAVKPAEQAGTGHVHRDVRQELEDWLHQLLHGPHHHHHDSPH